MDVSHCQAVCKSHLWDTAIQPPGQDMAWSSRSRDMEAEGRECSLVPGERLLLPGAAAWTEEEWCLGESVRLFARGRREKTQGEQCRAWKKPVAVELRPS